jgi:hypothetical protein
MTPVTHPPPSDVGSGRWSTRPPAWRAYGLAAAVTGLALAVLALQATWLTNLSLVWLVAAVAISAWYGGFGPGALAVGLGALLGANLMLPPTTALAIEALEDQARLVGFILVGLLVSGLSASLRAAQRRAERAWRRFHELVHNLDAIICGVVPVPYLLANSLWQPIEARRSSLMGCQAREGRAARPEAGRSREPLAEPEEIERGGGEDVAQMDPVVADVPRPAQAAATYPAGERAFDPDPIGPASLVVRRRRLPSRGLQRLELGLRAQAEHPARRPCPRAAALLAAGARPAVPGGELDPDQLVPGRVRAHPPAAAGPAGRAGGLLPLPVDLEMLDGEAGLLARLPLVVGAGGPAQRHLVIVAAGDDARGIQVPGVDRVDVREEVARLEALWIAGVAAASMTGAVVVSTCVMRWGDPASHVSVTWTLYPTHEVVSVRASWASRSCGEPMKMDAGGRSSLPR